MSWSDADAPTLAPAPVTDRLRKWFADPVNLAVPPVIVSFCVIRSWGLIADLPYWSIAVLVLGATVVNLVNSAFWVPGSGGWRLHVRVAVQMAVIAVVIYAIGWGPVLAIGFVFGAVDVMRTAGSAAGRPAIIWTVVFIAVGQLAIALGIAPTLIREPLIESLGLLVAVGTALTIKVLQLFAETREASEGRFKALVHEASDIIIVTDQSGKMRYASPAFERILGWPSPRFEGVSMRAFVHPDDLDWVVGEFPAMIADPSRVLHTLLRGRDSNGGWRFFETTITNRLNDPDVRGIVGNLHDITELREAHERFRSAFENAPIGMAMADLEGRILRANSSLGNIVGRHPAELVGVGVDDLTHPEDRASSAAERHHLISTGSGGYHIEKRYLHRDGRDVWVSVSVSCVRDETGEPLYLLGQVEDITERRALRERLAYASIHDALTGLPNRELFMDRLDLALRHAARDHHQVAVIFLDLDRFKLINDSLGHEAGDQLLAAVARRLEGVMRASDTLARFGGDEFTVLCDQINSEADCLEVANRLVRAMADPLALHTGDVFVTLSLGVALSGAGQSGGMILRNADIAMYRAKERGPSRIEIYREDEEQTVVSRLRTSNELHRALERHELVLHYQPIVDLHTETMVGMEALVRWQHPTRGLLAPQEFIPLAEDSGLIVPLGAWILKEACLQTARWQPPRASAGQDPARLNIAVNVSASQLSDPGFPRHVTEALDQSGIDPDHLWLEITESTLMRNADEAVVVLQSFKDLGLHIEIDDFGTGYSSLSYLQRFPAETLKIDRSFVNELDQISENAAIVRAIIGLGESLALSVIAEGVERPAQVSRLQALGCHLAQGYLFGRPLAACSLGEFPRDDLSSWTEQRDLAAS